MLERVLQKIIWLIFSPLLHRTEKKIGYRLVFRNIPSRFIDGIMPWDMTNVWKKFGLKIVAGANYWTAGKIVNGSSTRFDRNAPEYQSWLGGYVVKLKHDQTWTFEEHFNLAIADQNHWLMMRGDPNPFTSIDGWNLKEISKIQSGPYVGTLYEFGCDTLIATLDTVLENCLPEFNPWLLPPFLRSPIQNWG